MHLHCVSESILYCCRVSLYAFVFELALAVHFLSERTCSDSKFKRKRIKGDEALLSSGENNNKMNPKKTTIGVKN